MSAQPVLIFDSGVGGLSIFDAVRARLPQLPLVYACDNEGFPYGPRAADDLVRRVDSVLQRLITAVDPALVVIACNTASTVALPLLRDHYRVPFVGVVPAIKPAAQLSRNKVIGLLATPGTVQRPYTDDLIREFASDCTVKRIGSRALVEIAEDALRGGDLPLPILQQIIAPFFAPPAVDTVVLGCTHFPLLKDALAAVAPAEVQWVDSGAAIARRVAALWPTLATTAPHDATTQNSATTQNAATQNTTSARALVTRLDDDARALWPALHARGFSTLEEVPEAAQHSAAEHD